MADNPGMTNPRPSAVLPLPALLAVAVLLLTPGCGDPNEARANPAFAAKSTGGRFLIGLPEQYERPGVYTRFANEHGVFLVSGHGMLVALADTCPNPIHGRSVGVRWDPVSYTFNCPVCNWKFTSDGLPIANGADRVAAPGRIKPRALERCVIRHYGPLYDPDTQVEVNPVDANRLIHEDNEWSEPAGIYAFEPADGTGREPTQRRRILPVFQ